MITHTTPEEKLKDLRMGLEEASLLARDGGIHSARNILAEKIQQILMPELNASLAHLKADDQNEFVVHYTTIKSVVDMLRQVIRFNRREWRQTPNTSANQKPSGIVGTFNMVHAKGGRRRAHDAARFLVRRCVRRLSPFAPIKSDDLP